MNHLIYGVDTTKEVTPVIVRDALIQCFVEAHCEILDMMKDYNEFKSEKEFEEMKKMDIAYLIKTKFNEVGADFENPTKESLVKVIKKLAEYAVNFRKPEIVEKHYKEMAKLIDRI